MCGIVLRNFKFTSYKFLALTALFFGLAGSVHLFEPLDLFIKAISTKVRVHKASGDIVIVSLDDYAAKQGFSTPLPAVEAEKIFRAMLEAGADKVVLSEPVLVGSESETQRLELILSDHPERLFIVEPISSDLLREGFTSQYVSSHTQIHTYNPSRYWGEIQHISYSLDFNGRKLISAESALTGVYGDQDERFAIDYSINPRSVPYINFDFEEQSDLTLTVSGKSIVLGYESTINQNHLRILGFKGYFGLPTIITLGAETLKQGQPRYIDWYWIFILALLCGLCLLSLSKTSWQIMIGVITIISLVILTIVLNSMSIYAAVSCSVMFILFVTCYSVYRSTKNKNSKENLIHPDSNLPSLNALRLSSQSDRPLIVARISGFDELMGLLSSDERKTLASRLSSLAVPDSELWHGEDGHFYWFAKSDQDSRLSEHLESFGLILRNGFSIGNFPVSLQAVFGVDLRTEAGWSDRILGANLSAKRASAAGKTWMTYEEADKAETAWSITRLSELDQAIRTGQVYADLQPKVALGSGRITGVEALARWTHPIRGPVRPDEFIAAAENGNRIKELTIAVMNSALTSVQSAVHDDPDFKLSINITPSMLTDFTLPHTISALLAKYEIAPENLILEITESTAFADNETSVKSMHDLVDMGVTLSIDDYGTGNSTLDYLRKIPAQELKIDRKFISNISSNNADHMLVQSTIKLAHELNMSVVAEGVEDSHILDALQAMGCDQVQGYLISRPLNPEQFSKYMSHIRKKTRRVNIGL